MQDPCTAPAPAREAATPAADRVDALTPAQSSWLLYRLANADDHGENLTLGQALDQAETITSGPAS